MLRFVLDGPKHQLIDLLPRRDAISNLLMHFIYLFYNKKTAE